MGAQDVKKLEVSERGGGVATGWGVFQEFLVVF
jgi:hypothetical protein